MLKHRGTIAISLVCGLLLLAGSVWVASCNSLRDPLAISGAVDLTHWDSKDNPLLFLRGEWEFYWEKLLSPTDLHTRPEMTGFIDLPGSWNRYEVDGERLGAEGYATFVLTLKTAATGERLALNVSCITTSYKLWVNDELKVSVGEVGTSPETTTAADMPKYVEFTDDRTETRIIIQAANFSHRRGGIWSDLELGTAETIANLVDWRLMVDMGSLGALSIMGIYHLCLFAQRKRDKSNLYFGLLCLACSVRTIFLGQVVLTRLFPDFSWTTSVSLQYFASSALLPLGVAYAEASYPDEVGTSVTRLATIGWLVFAGVSVTMSPRVSTRLALGYEAFDVIICLFIVRIFALAVTRKRSGSAAVAIGAATFLLTILMDFLYFQEIISFGNFSQLGLVVLCFMQSYSMSIRFSKALATVEQLSEQLTSVNRELTDLNRHLEYRVDTRTSELLESNRKLEAINREIARIEESRKHLLANITHDLRTPVTLIRGYAEAMLDGIIEGPEAHNKYLNLIRSKVDGLTTLIEDLFELTQLESRRTSFDLEQIEICDLTEKLYRKYEHDIENAGLKPELLLPDLAEDQGLIYVNVDSDHIDRVVSNLVYNAIKFTPKGGWIRVACAPDRAEVIIAVQDSGPGIPENDAPFVFDRFYKAPRSRTSAPGSGLGLCIAKEIVELHGGRIWVESKPGQGSSFFFALPIVTKSVEEPLEE